MPIVGCLAKVAPSFPGWCIQFHFIALAVLLHGVLDTSGGVLSKADQIRSLSAQQAESNLPVRLRGVVTFHNESLFSRFIQDETAGIYLREETPELKPGDLVEVTGTTSAGEYAPVVKPSKVEVIGAAPLPQAKPVTYEQLASGSEDSQFVELTGIVRSVSFDEASRHHVITLASGGGRLTVYAREVPVARTDELVDSEIRVRGVCATQFNRQRQLFALRLMVPRKEDIVFVVPASEDPFSAPARTLGSLLQFAPKGTYGHRVKLVGTVVLHQPGNLLFIQDDKYGLQVQTRQATPLSVGDKVEVLGFPRQGQYTPVLEDAIYRKMASGAPPDPRDVTVDAVLSGIFDCRLVRLTGTLLDRGSQSREQFLVIGSGNFIFHAYLTKVDDPTAVSGLKNGSHVSLSGVCLIEPGDWQAGESWRARSFQLLTRSLADVKVLKEPPWWTLRRLAWAVAGMLLIIMAALAWVAVLRGKVRQQTGIIRKQMEMDAALKERYRDLFENANDMVFTLDLSGRLTGINSAGERMLQRNRESLLDANVISLVTEEQKSAAQEWLRQTGSGAELPTAEWDFINAAGNLVKVEISSRLVEQPGKVPEIEGIARDITERRRLERELLEISNREQRRIGHDLHDGVCQQLAGIAYMVDTLGDQLQEENRPERVQAEKIGSLITEATVQARSVARGLFPVRLEENGLLAALDEFSEIASHRFKIECLFESRPPAPSNIDNDTALHLYYIAHEALVNAVKHGKATRISITLEPAGDRYVLRVKDNGKGFQAENSNNTGMGIRIMRYRAKVIGATLVIKSEFGIGTEVCCSFSKGKPSSTRKE